MAAVLTTMLSAAMQHARGYHQAPWALSAQGSRGFGNAGWGLGGYAPPAIGQDRSLSRVKPLGDLTQFCWSLNVQRSLVQRLSLLGAMVAGIQACGPSDQTRAEHAEEKRIECMDKVCGGDTPPKAPSGYSTMKFGGQWFFVPRPYAKGSSGMAFYWPSKTPVTGPPGGGEFPEAGRHYYDVAIELFVRSYSIPPEPRGYRLVQLAEESGWVDSRTTLRRGLDSIRMKQVVGPRGARIGHVTYYVATSLTGFDGQPPVAECKHDHPDYGGGTGFLWRPGIWVGVRMDQKHCADWPELYNEITRILSLARPV